MKTKYDEYQAKLKNLPNTAATSPDAIRTDKQRELTTLQQSLEKFKEEAQTFYAKKQNDLLSPLYKKVGEQLQR